VGGKGYGLGGGKGVWARWAEGVWATRRGGGITRRFPRKTNYPTVGISFSRPFVDKKNITVQYYRDKMLKILYFIYLSGILTKPEF